MRYVGAVAGAVMWSLVGFTAATAQQKTLAPDLKALAEGKGASIPPEATVSWVENAKGRPALRVSSKKDDTVIRLDDVAFGNGVIEFDALGQSAPPQSSFIGVAFRVLDGVTHDAVYFRPFNFQAADADRRAHAVQYVSEPAHGWQELRTSKPGQYEKPILPAPDGDAWFHARIVVQKPFVRVYVGAAQEPALTVQELSDRSGGGVGLWVGPGEGGYIANLTITPSGEGGAR